GIRDFHVTGVQTCALPILKRSAKARTEVGLQGTLSSRLQPNHPTDDLSTVTLLVYTGLSLGSGDALIGLNPAIDTVDNIGAILRSEERRVGKECRSRRALD